MSQTAHTESALTDVGEGSVSVVGDPLVLRGAIRIVLPHLRIGTTPAPRQIHTLEYVV